MARTIGHFACLVVLMVFLVGCGAESAGRDWREYDRRAEYKGTKLFLWVKQQPGQGPNGAQEKWDFTCERGCLVIEGGAQVLDTTKIWYVYECDDWRVGKLGVRESKKFIITDPPGMTYVGATEAVPVSEIPDSVRKPAGERPEPQALSDTPVKVKYQLTSDPDGRRWLETGNVNLIKEGTVDLNNLSPQSSRGDFKLYLCDKELALLLSEPGDRFYLQMRVEPADWRPSFRTVPEALYRFIPQPIDRPLIERALNSGGK